MTRAHAAGVRMPYAAAPGRVRRWVDGRLGGRVVELVDCVGGMSPGPATRVRSTTGLRAFVKACGPELNPDTPDLLRTEARVLASLPAHPSLPRLLDLYDDGAWVALLVEDLDGSLPALPWRRPDLDRVAAALADARPALDTAEVAGIEKVRDSSPLLADRWRLLEPHLDRVDPWWRTHHDTLASHAARALVAVDGDVLLHWDVRSDNVVLTTDRTVLVDWGQCRRGAVWVDHWLLALDCSLSGGDVTTDERPRADPVLHDVDPADLLAVTSALALAFKARPFRPPTQGLPTLSETSERWAEALRPYLAGALGVAHP
jgi:hypothetical protein